MIRRLLVIITALLHSLPLRVVRIFGAGIGLCMYCNRRKRRIAYVNIRQAFPQKKPPELFRIIRRSFISFGMSIIETLLIDKTKNYVQRQWTEKMVSNPEIFVGIHQGNWESYHADVAGSVRLALLVEAQKYTVLDDYLNELRRRNNVIVCFTFKEMIAAIKQNNWIGLVVDHGAEKNACYVDFFGQLVPVPGGAVALAKKFQKRIFPSFGYREKGKHIFIIGDPIDCIDRSEEEVLREINQVYEEFLTFHPYDYMWWFKRFKRKKNRTILILSDGKAGHLKQSLALVEKFKKQGYRIKTEIIEIEYRRKKARVWLDSIAHFSSPRSLGKMKALRFFLKKDIFEKLENNFYDIVISTGSSIAAVNVLYARAQGVKSCTILKPNVPLDRFDVAVLPQHDKIEADNVIATKGALVYDQNTEDVIARGKAQFQLTGEKKIAVFIGNSLENSVQYQKNVALFLKNLKSYCLEHRYRIVLTTSRRTSKELDEIIERELKDSPMLESLVFVSKENYPFVVPLYLASSDIVFISAESVSMISESLYMNKTTVAVFFEELTSKSHLRFLSSLEDGYVNLFKAPYETFSFRPPRGSLREENELQLQKAVDRLL